MYRLSGVIKAFTAVVSVATAVMLVKFIPQALALPSPTQLRTANLKLENEIKERLRVQTALQRAHDELEARVRNAPSNLQMPMKNCTKKSSNGSMRKRHCKSRRASSRTLRA